MTRVRKVVLAGLLLAATIVLARVLAVRTPIVSIGFTFVPHILTAILLGPKYSVAISGLADVIGALLFPVGAYYFGFTLSALVSGLIYGLILYRRGKFRVDRRFFWRLVLATLLVVVLVNGVLNTVWVWQTTQGAAGVVMTTRVVKQLVVIPVQIMTMMLLLKVFEKQMDRLKNDRAEGDRV